MELQSRSKALAGDFAGAIVSLEAAQIRAASERFEKLRIFERQGQFKLAKEIANYMPNDAATVTELYPLAAARAYVRCITDGAWLDALQEVCIIFAGLLATEDQPGLDMLVVSGASC
jgi:hypothetical protein